MSWRRCLALPATLALFGVGAPSAHATLEVSSNSTDGLIVVDKHGLPDRVLIQASVSQGDPVYFVTSSSPIDLFKFDFKQGCSPHDGNTAVCQKLRGKINVAMAGGNDDLATANTTTVQEASVNLGGGDDVYSGIEEADNVFAATGSDRIETHSGADRVTILAGGTDEVDAGSGNDTIDDSDAPFSSSGFVEIKAGFGNDVVSLQMRAFTVLAGPGDDTVTTGPSDTIQGPSDDFVGGDAGNDTITTGEGADVVDGGTGEDKISTGSGADQITSKEVVIGRPRDRVTAFRDEVRCGLGSDEVTADLMDEVDAIGNPGGGTCEDVDTSPVAETPHVRIEAETLRVRPAGNVNVLLRCPRGVKRLGCEGTLQLRIDRRSGARARASRSRKVRYRIRAGRRRTVALRLSGGDVRTLRRRQRRGRETHGILTSVERGVKGRKTTVRNPRLRLRKG